MSRITQLIETRHGQKCNYAEAMAVQANDALIVYRFTAHMPYWLRLVASDPCFSKKEVAKEPFLTRYDTIRYHILYYPLGKTRIGPQS